jgi:carbonic anhydrase
MKIAKFVVIGQVILSAILVVVFITKSGATPAPAQGQGSGKARSHAAGERAAAAAAAVNDREEGPDPAWGEDPEADGRKAKKKGEHEAGKGKLAHADKDGTKEAIKSGIAAPAALPSDPKAMAQVLLAGNARFMEGVRTGFNLVQQREASAGTQRPGVMVLGCADSQVSPELVFDRGVGEMFVVRSVGNIAEAVAVGSLEYAAERLDAKVLLVLGHEKCGAVQAALSEAKMPSPNLEAVMASILPAVKELKSWSDGDQLMHMAVEANVRRQAEEVLRRSPMLRQMVTRKELTVLKAVYDMETGQVHPL